MRTIENILKDIVTKNYQMDLSIELSRPLLSLEDGLVSNPVCQNIAALLKLDPEIISKKIIEELKEAIQSEVYFNEGYLNFRLVKDQHNLLAVEQGYYNKKIAIWLAPNTENVDKNEYIRFIAHAFLQAVFLKNLNLNFTFQIGSNLLEVNSIKEILDQFSAIARGILDNSSNSVTSEKVHEEVSVFNLKPLEYDKVIWLMPRSLTKKNFNSLTRGIKDQSTIINCPQQSRLANIEDIDTLLFKSFDALSLLCLLVSPIQGADFDWYIAKSNENSNLLWYINSTIDRVCKVIKINEIDYSTALRSNDPHILNLLNRIEQLERLVYFAGVNGEVMNWHIGMNSILNDLNKIFNSPDVRNCLVEKSELCQYYPAITYAVCNIKRLNKLRLS